MNTQYDKILKRSIKPDEKFSDFVEHFSFGSTVLLILIFCYVAMIVQFVVCSPSVLTSHVCLTTSFAVACLRFACNLQAIKQSSLQSQASTTTHNNEIVQIVDSVAAQQ